MTDGPKRVQLSRAKGWRLPENTVKVTRPGRWGNSFRAGDDHSYYLPNAESATTQQCVELFRAFAEALRDTSPDQFREWLSPLRGRSLACWCKLGEPCHADVLLEIANA